MFREFIQKERNFLILLLAVSLIIRLAIAPLYINEHPGEMSLPHDIPRYLATARTILEGKTLYLDCNMEFKLPCQSVYGPVFAVSYAAWIYIGGTGYFYLKTFAILFSILTIAIVYFITRKLTNFKYAAYASTLYAFSYASLLSSGVTGDDDIFGIFFALLSIYFLITSNYKLSAVALAITSAIKAFPIPLFIPIAFYYVYRKKGLKPAMLYASVSALAFGAINFPFWIKAGKAMLLPYFLVGYPPAISASQGILNGLRITLNYFGGAAHPLMEAHPLIGMLYTPFFLAGLIIGYLFIFKFKKENLEFELIRNLFIIGLVMNIFARVIYTTNYFWLLPIFLIYIFTIEKPSELTLGKPELCGFILIFLSVLSYALFYKWWWVEYSNPIKLLMLGAIFAGAFGTYLTMSHFKFRLEWALVTLSLLIYLPEDLAFYTLLSPILPFFESKALAIGAQIMTSIAVQLIAILFLSISAIRQETGEQRTGGHKTGIVHKIK